MGIPARFEYARADHVHDVIALDMLSSIYVLYVLLLQGAAFKPVIKCCLFLSFFQCLVSRAPLSAMTKSLA